MVGLKKAGSCFCYKKVAESDPVDGAFGCCSRNSENSTVLELALTHILDELAKTMLTRGGFRIFVKRGKKISN